jgi:hypothetical protein
VLSAGTLEPLSERGSRLAPNLELQLSKQTTAHETTCRTPPNEDDERGMSQPNGVAVPAKDNGDTEGDSPSSSQRSGTARPLVIRLPKSTPPAGHTQEPSPPLERASPNDVDI